MKGARLFGNRRIQRKTGGKTLTVFFWACCATATIDRAAHRPHCSLLKKMNFSYLLNGDRDSVLRQSLGVFRNPSRSVLCFDSQSPAGNPPTKAGFRKPGRQSRTVTQLRAVSQLVAIRLWRTAVTRLCTDNSARTAFISRHPSGAPGVASPNGCQPTKAGQTTDAEKIDSQGIWVIRMIIEHM